MIFSYLIYLPCFNIVVKQTQTALPDEWSWTITSNLIQPCNCITGGCDGCFEDAGIKGILNLVLSHARSGIDIKAPLYIEGIEAAVAEYQEG